MVSFFIYIYKNILYYVHLSRLDHMPRFVSYRESIATIGNRKAIRVQIWQIRKNPQRFRFIGIRSFARSKSPERIDFQTRQDGPCQFATGRTVLKFFAVIEIMFLYL